MEPVALQVKVPDAMTSLASVAGIASTLQSLKKATSTFEADVAKAKAESRSAEQAAQYAEQTLGSRVRAQEAATSTAETGAQSAKWKLNQEQANQMYDIAGALATHPAFVKGDSDGMVDALLEQKQVALNYGIDPRKVEVQFSPLFAKAAHDPKGAQDMLKRIILAGQPRTQQSATIAPPVDLINNGQQTVGVNRGTNMFDATGGTPGVAGPVVQSQLPPTTPSFNPVTNAPGYVGPTPETAPPVKTPKAEKATGQRVNNAERIAMLQEELARERSLKPNDSDGLGEKRKAENIAALENEIKSLGGAKAQLGAQFDARRVQSGPALGAEATANILPTATKEEWDKTRSYASTASQDIGVLQNIKKYTKQGAITGAFSDRRALANSIGDLIGIPADQAEKTNTDLLAKNANMLALVGGNTDAARALAEAANPNLKMNAAAIEAAANQIIAQKRTGLEKAKFLEKYVGDPKEFNKKLVEWNANADPRILQLSEMSTEEKQKLRKSMSDKEYADFRAKVEWMHNNGVAR